MAEVPYYQSPGSETVINEPGHYKGYFCKFCHDSKSSHKFIAPTNWTVKSCVYMPGLGSHGCCIGCVVVLIELFHVNYGTFEIDISSVPTNGIIQVDGTTI